jgi:hypothetical protein
VSLLSPRSERVIGLKRDWHSAAVVQVLLTVSLAANVFFALQYFRSARVRARSAAITVKAGTRLPPIEAFSLDGNRVVISCPQSKKGTVLYVFSPECRWCEQNLPNILSLKSQVGDQYEFVAVSLSENGLREYIRNRGFPLTVLVRPTPASVSAYQLRSTPTTYLLSPDHVVVHGWVGAYTGITQHAIERAFGVQLPGLAG